MARWVLFAWLIVSGSAVAADSYEFEHVTCAGADSTELKGNNDVGGVVGDSSLGGFSLDPNGTCTLICTSDFPGAFYREGQN